MQFLSKLFARQAIATWQDEVTFSAAATLNQAACDLIAQYDLKVCDAKWGSGLLQRGQYIRREVAPVLDEASIRISRLLVADASAHLRHVANVEVGLLSQSEMPDVEDRLAADWADASKAAAPIVGAVAAGLALPGAAVTTTTAWFGLVSATVISWPIVIGGGVAIGGMMLAGAHNATRVRGGFEARLRDKIRAYINEALLRGKPGRPSALERLQLLYAEAADEARARAE